MTETAFCNAVMMGVLYAAATDDDDHATGLPDGDDNGSAEQLSVVPAASYDNEWWRR